MEELGMAVSLQIESKRMVDWELIMVVIRFVPCVFTVGTLAIGNKQFFYRAAKLWP
jgi:hypothetical protein